jgi:hypothetical protein
MAAKLAKPVPVGLRVGYLRSSMGTEDKLNGSSRR